MSFNIKDTESKVTPAKKTLDLKNISVSDLRLVDTDSGEDISQQVIDAIPEYPTNKIFLSIYYHILKAYSNVCIKTLNILE